MNRSKKKSFDWYGARQRFSIRKYHIGAASVLLGMTLVLSTGTIVGAETGVNGDGASNEQIVPGNDAGTSNGTTNPTANDQPAGDTGSASSLPVGTSRSADTGTQGDGSTHQPVDEPIIKFPTQDNQAKPAGYQKVEFSTAYSTLVFEGNPGEIQNGNSKTVVFWVKTGTTWGALMSDPQFRIPKYTVADGDFILGYAKNVGQVAYPIDFDSLKDTPIVDTWQINTIVDYIIGDVTDGRTFEEYMNSGSYAPFYIPQFHGITLDANGGTVGGKAKKAFYVAYQHVQWGDQRVTSKIVDPSRDGYTFVRWQTATGERIPTSGQIDTIEFTAVWLEHPTDKVAVFDRTNLTDSEKEQVKKKIYDANPDLSTGVAQVIKAIEISDTGEATVTFDDNKVVTVSSTTLINEDQDTARSNAKAEIEQEATEKSDAINASALTEEEKIAKLAEVDNKKAAADSAIDRANTSDELNTALEAGKSAIAGIDTSTSAKKTQAKEELKAAAEDAKKAIDANDNLTDAEKKAAKDAVDNEVAKANDAIDAATKADEVDAATLAGEKAIAKQDLETAYNAKKNEIANSALTAKEKAAKQAELDQAKSAADSAIDAATDYAGVTQALKDGKKAIAGINTSTSAGINTSTSAKKAQAKQDLETAYNAKKAEIDNSALTAGEKVAKQAELDKAKADADKAINAATDNAGVAKALEDGKKAIAGIDTSTSAKKAQAKQDLEVAYNAKKEEIANSALTAEEKAAKQAELDKAKADADKAIDAATDDAGVAKALEDGKAAIDAINTSTSAGIDTSTSAGIDTSTSTSTSAGIDTSTSAMKAGKKNTVLPKTGDNVGLSNILGVAGLALLGTAIRKKRED
ncbi:DUF1542 domain-containing protein [Streptococcus suis]|nr:DUF1542 domain-containing protein [Streptococcus suis]